MFDLGHLRMKLVFNEMGRQQEKQVLVEKQAFHWGHTKFEMPPRLPDGDFILAK